MIRILLAGKEGENESLFRLDCPPRFLRSLRQRTSEHEGMFYWSHRGIHVTLTDDEEMRLVRELCGREIGDVIGYDMFKKTRRKYESRIFDYLRSTLSSDPEGFRKRFQFRSCFHAEAVKILPLMLDAYGRITKLATIGSYGGDPLFDDAVESIVQAASGAVTHISIFHKRRWPWSRLTVACRVAIPNASIERVAGTVDNFALMTETLSVRFGRDLVRITARK